VASATRRHNHGVLPAGVELTRLRPHADSRGVFTELFRDSWGLDVSPTQWNVVRSEPNVLRGVHAHWRHADYLAVVAGRAEIALHDLREGSSTEGLGALVRLSADEPLGLTIPPGVAHGFYFPELALHVYAVSHEWDPADELGCRWDDPALGVDWSCTAPLLSERDEALGPLSELRDACRRALATAAAH
jgi:dTDP-4-dehydrorhamnose 3,5-epimerase